MVARGPPLSRAASNSSSLIETIPSLLGRMLRIEQLDRRAGHDRRDGVLVDQLRLRIAPKQQAEVVEPGNNALELVPVHEEDRDRDLLLANMIEEGVLQVL